MLSLECNVWKRSREISGYDKLFVRGTNHEYDQAEEWKVDVLNENNIVEKRERGTVTVVRVDQNDRQCVL